MKPETYTMSIRLCFAPDTVCQVVQSVTGSASRFVVDSEEAVIHKPLTSDRL